MIDILVFLFYFYAAGVIAAQAFVIYTCLKELVEKTKVQHKTIVDTYDNGSKNVTITFINDLIYKAVTSYKETFRDTFRSWIYFTFFVAGVASNVYATWFLFRAEREDIKQKIMIAILANPPQQPTNQMDDYYYNRIADRVKLTKIYKIAKAIQQWKLQFTCSSFPQYMSLVGWYSLA